MNAATLIALLQDLRANTTIYFEDGEHELWGIFSIASVTTNSTHIIELRLQRHRLKTYKVWEVIVLLQQADPQTLVAVTHTKKRQLIFGIRLAGRQVYLK